MAACRASEGVMRQALSVRRFDSLRSRLIGT
jgi:hypothetical protein